MISHLPCTRRKGEKAYGSEQQKAAVLIGFWKLCIAPVHVDTAFNKQGSKSSINKFAIYMQFNIGFLRILMSTCKINQLKYTEVLRKPPAYEN